MPEPTKSYYPNGKLRSEEYRNAEGKLHRTDGPAATDYLPHGQVYETYYHEGEIHREDGPAQIWYYPDGKVFKRAYYRDGKLHRSTGPAVIMYHSDESIYSEEYCENGKWLHDKTQVYSRVS
tara:strand:- start:8796 stop:9161 length:366 start_codon:yes stop_codon:yes gene_type:complete